MSLQKHLVGKRFPGFQVDDEYNTYNVMVDTTYAKKNGYFWNNFFRIFFQKPIFRVLLLSLQNHEYITKHFFVVDCKSFSMILSLINSNQIRILIPVNIQLTELVSVNV